MGKRKKENLTPEQIQANVDAVMAGWRSYRDFASFLNALMQANDNMSNLSLAQELSKHDYTAYDTARTQELPKASHSYSSGHISAIRNRHYPPSYQLTEDLLTANPLHLRPVTIEGQVLDPRIILFTMAELREVTAESTLEFTKDVMAWVSNELKAGNKLHWADIMQKLLDFRIQGNRSSIRLIQQTLCEQMKADDQYKEKGYNGTNHLLGALNKECHIIDGERLALYDYLRLNDDQKRILRHELISDALFSGQANDFSRTLDDILKRLKQGINGQSYHTGSLGNLSRDPKTGKARFDFSSLSAWRHGKVYPALSSLRALVEVLQTFVIPGGILRQDDIDTLIKHSGFTSEQLTQTAHDIIDKSNAQTADIHKLLGAIRNATDIDVSTDTAAATIPANSQLALTLHQIIKWEVDATIFPPAEPLQELMLRYNHLLREDNHAELTKEDTDKVLLIAENSRARFTPLSSEEKTEISKPKNWRTIITAEIKASKTPDTTAL